MTTTPSEDRSSEAEHDQRDPYAPENIEATDEYEHRMLNER